MNKQFIIINLSKKPITNVTNHFQFTKYLEKKKHKSCLSWYIFSHTFFNLQTHRPDYIR